jgi:CheY-like chemotaxis protein
LSAPPGGSYRACILLDEVLPMAEPARSPLIAVVDDDKLALTVLTDLLTKAGYRVAGFRSAEAALRSLWDGGANLLVMDLVLPRMNGLCLASELRRRPWAQKLPIVVVSALELGGEKVAEHISTGLVDAVLRKPVSKDDLLPIVSELLAARPMESCPTPPPQLKPRAPGAPGSTVDVRLRTAREYMVEYSDNLALGGIFVRTFEPLPPETEVKVSLSLPFRYGNGEIHLRGRVMRAVYPDSAGGRTGEPGMGIALLDVPEDLKAAMEAYVAGYRAGCVANAPPPAPTVVLLVGLQTLLPGDVRSFLRRGGLFCARCAKLSDAPAAIARIRPKVVVLERADLGESPRQAIEPLRQGQHKLLVVGEEPLESLGDQVSFIDPGEPQRLLDQISHAVDLLQRRATRVPARGPVTCRRAEGALNGVLLDVSLTGVSMLLEGECAIGEKLSIGFKLPEQQEEIHDVVSVVRVGRAAGEPPMARVGAVFESISEDSTELLRRFVATRSGLRAYVHLADPE